MSVLTHPRHPLIDRALALARDWCHGRTIDDAPALAHAVHVAGTLVRHVPAARPQLVAAVLLHDAPEFAPPGDLDRMVGELGADVLAIVRAMEYEHETLGQADPVRRVDELAAGDPEVLLALVADMIVAFESLMRRARASGDPAGFWAQRQTLAGLMPYFTGFAAAAAARVPQAMGM